MTDKVKVPAWAAITRLSSTKEVKDQKAAVNGPNMEFRRLIAIPPFLHKSIISATSRDPGDLLIDCMTAITVFDNTHKDDDDFPDGLDACKRLLYFLWAATHNKIKETICIHISSGPVKQYCLDLTNQYILSPTATQPDGGALPGPSNATFTHLSGSVLRLTNRLDQDSLDRQSNKVDKKDKFSKLPTASQSLILLASSTSTTITRTTVHSELELLFQQS